MRYVAWLRGINVGGNKTVNMAALAKMCEKMGCKGVRTLLNSGNVVFDSAKSEQALVAALEKQLKSTFGFEVRVVVRSLQQIAKLIKAEPFKGVCETDETSLYVAFLSDEPAKDKTAVFAKLTHELETFRVEGREAFVVCRKKRDKRNIFTNVMLEKTLGVVATTRNWRTVLKIVTL